MSAKRLAALIAAVTVATSACAASTATPAGAPVAGYPVTVTNCGTQYTYSTAPSRVVVMNGGSVAEVSSLLALGLGDRIVANAQSYGASEVAGRVDAIAALPTGGITLNDMMDIPREAMIGLRPDFVLSTYDGGFRADAGFATRDDLRAAGANSYAPESSCGDAATPSIDDSYHLLRDLGTIFGVREKAESIIAASKERIAAVTEKATGKPANVLLVIPGMSMGGDIGSIGGNGIWNDIFAKAGARNAAGDAKDMFANLSRERLAAADVDALVVVNYMSADPDADARKILDQFPQWDAAKHDRYVVLSDSVYFGPSNDLAVAKIAELVHPEKF
jgi:iron complex transport system substrate-binding protein